MPKPPLSASASRLLAEPNPAVVATVRSDGYPLLVVTWYLWHGGQVLVSFDEHRERLEHLRQDPQVTLTVLTADDSAAYVSVQGRVTELRDDDDLADMDRITQHYTGKRYWDRDARRVSAGIEVEHWHGWGEAKF